MDNEGFKQVEYSIPESPGVYRYFDKNEALLYVGKAKNLRKRVSQYFLEQRSPNRIRLMVRLIHRIEFTVVDTEHDALLLENVLIKKLQPRYNIRLKDDKTYPFLVLRNEHFPRLEVTRKVQKDGARYFGPYTSPPAMYTLLELVRRLYPLRTCALLLSPSNIKKAGYRPCLEYQLGNCKAPCAGLQNEEEYRELTEAVHQLLKGNLGGLIKSLRVQLQEAVKRLAFEEAHRIKEQVEMLEKYQARSTVVSTKIHDLDAYALARHRDRAVVNHLHVLNGAVVRSYNLEFRLALEDEEDSSRLMAQAMLEIAERYRHEPREMRHVDHQLCARCMRDGRKLFEVERTRIRRCASDDDFWLRLINGALHCVPIHQTIFGTNAVEGWLKPLSRDVDRRAVREVSALVEAHGNE